jgi:2-polyprenyl-6-hydroxyphenyl methylase/3-demethylubiquinone-9 3-methyltransferase
MADYYSQRLSAERLKKCYDIAPLRIRQYLKAESNFITSFIRPTSTVLELGCGYGRVMTDFCNAAKEVVGIDSSMISLKMAADFLKPLRNYHLAAMDASRLGFANNIFDITVCIQNGISAFHVSPADLLAESVRVTKPGGRLLFSSYSEKIWDDRLQWFELQAREKLLGSIDYEKTGNGKIFCTDGFTATTFSPDMFRALATQLGLNSEVVEIDNSSIFCIMDV